MSVERWTWNSASGPARLDAELADAGVAWLHAPELVEAAERDPWGLAERLLGDRPVLLERQPIRPVPNGRTFASGRMAAPFHSDSQMFLGVPPHVQVMACRTPAGAGGESLYLDTWALLARVEREDPPLLARLFEEPRRFPFVFGDVYGPTASLRGGSLVFTHSAQAPPPASRHDRSAHDAIPERMRPHLEATPPVEISAAAGDVIVIHNHRVLHGRRAFDDTRRAFTRVLIWRGRPWPAPERWHARAAAAARTLADRRRDMPAAERDAADAAAPIDPQVWRRLTVVLELLRGVPAGVLSAREGVPEPELYRWRDDVLRGAAQALAIQSAR